MRVAGNEEGSKTRGGDVHNYVLKFEVSRGRGDKGNKMRKERSK